jgi:hypothetical protein
MVTDITVGDVVNKMIMIEEIEYVINHPKLTDDYKFNEICRLLNFNSNEVSLSEMIDVIYNEFKITYGNTRTRNNPSRLKSANVWKFKYDDKKLELTVQFQTGAIYTYSGVSPILFDTVIRGNAECITEGENQWGKWFVGKTPSVGAAIHKHLVLAGVAYAKGGSI